MTRITRDVVTDLWPVYESGEASADTRALIEEFLASDPEFARTMRSGVSGLDSAVDVRPDTETLALQRTRDLVRGNAWLRGVRLLALVLTGLTFARIMTDSRPASVFIPHAIVSIVAWILYGSLLRWYRLRSLR
jgi:hypothetical protein